MNQNNTPKEQSQASRKVAVLHDVFQGRTDLFAFQNSDGSYTCVHKPLDEDLLAIHCEANQTTLAVYPVTDQGYTTLGLIDIDSKLPIAKEVALFCCSWLAHFNLHALIASSGRKGYHCWLLLKCWVPAAKVRRILKAATDAWEEKHGKPPFGIEVFPKQTSATAEKPGSCVKLPFSKHQVSKKLTAFLDSHFEPMSDWGIPAIEALPIMSEADFDAILAELPAESTTITKQAGPIPTKLHVGDRRPNLFSLAGSMRHRGMSEEAIFAALSVENLAKCDPPLDDDKIRELAKGALRYEPAEEPAAPVHLTDMGNATRFVAQHGENIRYCYQWGSWLIWDGHHWTQDEIGQIYQLAKDTVRGIYLEAANTQDQDERGRLVKWALSSESQSHLTAMVALAESEVPIRSDDLDQNPWLLNTLSGTIDLQTGRLREHRREDNLTKLAPVEYNSKAKCTRWLKFLLQIMGRRKPLVRFLQRAAGYTLTGDCSERALFIPYGTGSNGKTTLMETYCSLLGDYAWTVDVDMLLLKRYEAIPCDRAKLKGIRFAYAQEPGAGCILNEGKVKALTGNDRIPARFLHHEWFNFPPTHKLWLSGNHKPIIIGTDRAIWQRLKLIPFDITIPEAKQDTHLKEKLLSEGPGILAWAIRGCLEWQAKGLDFPDEVTKATSKYKEEMDIVGDFISENCVLQPEARALAGALYKAFCAWAQSTGNYYISQREFGERLRERELERKRGTGNTHWWVGIGLKIQPGLKAPEPEKISPEDTPVLDLKF